MTCIVGLVKDGVTYIAGDSLGSNGYSGAVYKGKKVAHLDGKEEAIMGYTTSFRMGQLVEHSSGLIEEIALLKGEVDDKYLVTKFVPNLQKLYKEGGFEKVRDNQKIGGTFLLGFKNRLFCVQSDYSILESANHYDSCGCGEDFAMGAMKATENMKMTPEERLFTALESAAKFSTGVDAPFYIVNTVTKEVLELDEALVKKSKTKSKK